LAECILIIDTNDVYVM